MTVPPALVVRAKSHFHSLPYGVDLIIGLNGYIWISKTLKKEMRRDGEEAGFGEESGEGVYSGENEVSLHSPSCSRSVSDLVLRDDRLLGDLFGSSTKHHTNIDPYHPPLETLHPSIGRTRSRSTRDGSKNRWRWTNRIEETDETRSWSRGVEGTRDG